MHMAKTYGTETTCFTSRFILESQVFSWLFLPLTSDRQDSKEAVVIDPLHELIRPTLTLLAELGLQLKYAALQRCDAISGRLMGTQM